MNSSSSLFILIIVLVASVIDQVHSAASCYQCSGTTCSATAQSCGSSLDFCQKVLTTTAGITVTVKSCTKYCNDGQVETYGPTNIKYYCCTSDNCNGVGSEFDLSTGKRLAFLISSLASFVLIRLF